MIYNTLRGVCDGLGKICAVPGQWWVISTRHLKTYQPRKHKFKVLQSVSFPKKMFKMSFCFRMFFVCFSSFWSAHNSFLFTSRSQIPTGIYRRTTSHRLPQWRSPTSPDHHEQTCTKSPFLYWSWWKMLLSFHNIIKLAPSDAKDIKRSKKRNLFNLLPKFNSFDDTHPHVIVGETYPSVSATFSGVTFLCFKQPLKKIVTYCNIKWLPKKRWSWMNNWDAYMGFCWIVLPSETIRSRPQNDTRITQLSNDMVATLQKTSQLICAPNWRGKPSIRNIQKHQRGVHELSQKSWTLEMIQ